MFHLLFAFLAVTYLLLTFYLKKHGPGYLPLDQDVLKVCHATYRGHREMRERGSVCVCVCVEMEAYGSLLIITQLTLDAAEKNQPPPHICAACMVCSRSLFIASPFVTLFLANNVIPYCMQTLKLPRSHHCHVCDRCVAKFDHHNFRFDACVGVKNHVLFDCIIYSFFFSFF